MPDIMAIISKAVFEKDARRNGKLAMLGDVVALDRYNSANKGLDPLKGGGRLFLVTVRPPDEQLWLVAVLHDPKPADAAWIAAQPSAIPMTNVAHLRRTLRFESGKGLSQDKGALGMSLQTPRALAASDVELLLGAAGASASTSTDASGPSREPLRREPLGDAARALLAELEKDPSSDKVREQALRQVLVEGAYGEAGRLLEKRAILNAHDPAGLPCLCRKCFAGTSPEIEWTAQRFVRDVVLGKGRALLFWAPKELMDSAVALRNSTRASLGARAQLLDKGKKRLRPPPF